MTSAPRAPSQRVAHGPARTQLKSTTRTPSRARRRDILWVSSAAKGQAPSPDDRSIQLLHHSGTALIGARLIPTADLIAGERSTAAIGPRGVLTGGTITIRGEAALAGRH